MDRPEREKVKWDMSKFIRNNLTVTKFVEIVVKNTKWSTECGELRSYPR